MSRFSLLEALWLAVKLKKEGRFDQRRFAAGLISVLEGGRYSLAEESHVVFEKALRYYEMGHSDIIDNILYATAEANGLLFLTIDEELRKFAKRNSLPELLIGPEQL